MPRSIELLRRDSLRRSTRLRGKHARSLELKVCQDDLIPATSTEAELLQQLEPASKLLLACAREKDTGGSAGLRMLVGIYDGAEIYARELKPLSSPASVFPLRPEIPERVEILSTALEKIFAGLPGYSAVVIEDRSYLWRRMIGGDVSVELGKHSSLEVAYYQAYVLGTLHEASDFRFAPEEWGGYSEVILKAYAEEFLADIGAGEALRNK
jgi:hypothetical protein